MYNTYIIWYTLWYKSIQKPTAPLQYIPTLCRIYFPPPTQKLYALSHHVPHPIPSLVGGGGCTYKTDDNPNLPHLHSITGGPLVLQLLWFVWTPSLLNYPPITVHNRISHFVLKLLQLTPWGSMIPHPHWCQYVRLMHMTDLAWWW